MVSSGGTHRQPCRSCFAKTLLDIHKLCHSQCMGIEHHRNRSTLIVLPDFQSILIHHSGASSIVAWSTVTYTLQNKSQPAVGRATLSRQIKLHSTIACTASYTLYRSSFLCWQVLPHLTLEAVTYTKAAAPKQNFDRRRHQALLRQPQKLLRSALAKRSRGSERCVPALPVVLILPACTRTHHHRK